MAKLVLNNVANLQSETTAVQVLNDNFAKIVAALENTISRDGSSPNYLSDNLDLNSKRILNLPLPVSPNEPLRLADVGGVLPSSIASAGAFAAQAQAAATAAAASAVTAAGYVGAATSAPKWSTARAINLFGDLSGTSVGWDGSVDLNFTGITINNNAVTAPKIAAGAAVANIGYTPLNKAGDVLTGDVRLNYAVATLFSDSVGFRGIPINIQDAIYTFTVNDCGRMVRHTSSTAHTYWIDTNSTQPYPIGAAIAVRNVGPGVVSVRRGPGVALRKVASGTDQDVDVAQWGVCTIIQESSNVWVASGQGIT